MALFGGSIGGMEACGISWRFRGSTNTPFKPVGLPLPVSCGELRAALKEEIGLTLTPQIDVLLFFAEDEETSQHGRGGDGRAAVPLSNYLTLSRPCKVVLQRTSAAAAREALSHADAVYQGSTREAKKNQQLQYNAGKDISEAGGSVPPGSSQQQQHQQRIQHIANETVGSEVKEQQQLQHIGCTERDVITGSDAAVIGRGDDRFSTAVPASQQQKEPIGVQQQQIQQQGQLQKKKQQQLHEQENVQYIHHNSESTVSAEDEEREAESRLADEEAEAALLHAVIEKHAEHRGPQQQSSGNHTGIVIQRNSGGGWGAVGGNAGWGRGIGGGIQQRRNMVWSRDGIGSTSAAAVAATTSIPVALAAGSSHGVGGGKGAAGAHFHNRMLSGGRGGSAGNSGYYGYYHFPVDADYICHFCGDKGTHHIKNCTKAQDPRQQKKVKPATGIPNSFLQDIDVDDIPSYQEVYIRRDGSFAVMKNTKNLSSHSFFSVDLETKVERHTGSSSCTSQLRCGLCNMVFRNPVITPCCGETFCRGCLVRALQQQHVLHRFEEQQHFGGTYSTQKREKLETGGGLASIKQEMSPSETYLPPAAIAGGGAAERGKRMRYLSQHVNAHGGATGNAVRGSRGGGTGGAVMRRSARGGSCPACGSHLDLKDVVENVALRKCVDAVVLSSSSQEKRTTQALQQKQHHAPQSGSKEILSQQQRQPQQQQQEARRSVKELRGGEGVQQPSQSQVKVEKKEQISLAVKQEREQVVKKEHQQMHTQSGATAEVNDIGLAAAAVCPTVAEDNIDSRVKPSAAVASSSGVSAARVVVKTEVGAAASAAAAPVDLPFFGVCSTNRSGSPSFSVSAPPSPLPGEKKIQHHADSPAVLFAAAPTDTHKVSATAASAAPAALSACVSTEEGFCVGSQPTVSHVHEPAATMASSRAPTITSDASKHVDFELERPRNISSSVTVTNSSSGSSTCETSTSDSYSSSSAAETHVTTAAVADGTSALSSGNVHLSGGSPPLPRAVSLQHYVSGASCASDGGSASRMNHSSSCSGSSSSKDAVCVVQGERATSTDAVNAASAVAHALGPETQGDRAAATRPGVLNGLDMSQLQE